MGQPRHKVLLVDDDPAICRLFRVLLSELYDVREVASGEEALDVVKSWFPSLVLLDVHLTDTTGFEVCRRISELSDEHSPQVMMVSAHSSYAEQSLSFEVGAHDYLIKPVDPAELKSRVQLHIRYRESQFATALLHQKLSNRQAELWRSKQERIKEVIAIQDVAVFTLAKVAESRDNETGEHIERMREYSQLLAKNLRDFFPDEIDESFLADFYRSTPLHDIGKVGIPDAILLKPGKLTTEEFDVMKRHAVIGSDILLQAVTEMKRGGFLAMAATIALSHHERWDGAGYPEGLSGNKIPLPARIAAVADVYDALTSERPYKEAWSPIRAKQLIDDGAGTQFDPVVVEAFDRLFEDFVCIQHDYADRSPNVVETAETPTPCESPISPSE